MYNVHMLSSILLYPNVSCICVQTLSLLLPKRVEFWVNVPKCSLLSVIKLICTWNVKIYITTNGTGENNLARFRGIVYV